MQSIIEIAEVQCGLSSRITKICIMERAIGLTVDQSLTHLKLIGDMAVAIIHSWHDI